MNYKKTCNVFQAHQWPSGYSFIQLPHTSQQQEEIQPLKEDAAVPYKIRFFKYSFFPRTTRNWNQLPAAIAETPDLVSFKRGLSSVTF